MNASESVEAYSGPASAYGIIGKTEDAYFRMINDQGGVNGRKINLQFKGGKWELFGDIISAETGG